MIRIINTFASLSYGLFITRILVGIGWNDTAAARTTSEAEDHGDTKVEKDETNVCLKDRDVAGIPFKH